MRLFSHIKDQGTSSLRFLCNIDGRVIFSPLSILTSYLWSGRRHGAIHQSKLHSKSWIYMCARDRRTWPIGRSAHCAHSKMGGLEIGTSGKRAHRARELSLRHTIKEIRVINEGSRIHRECGPKGWH